MTRPHHAYFFFFARRLFHPASRARALTSAGAGAGALGLNAGTSLSSGVFPISHTQADDDNDMMLTKEN